MSVKYKKVQSNMKGNSSFGKWYGKAVVSDVVDVDTLSSNIGNRCTVTKPDIVAVISALVDEMKAQLQMGNRVVLDGFGSFKVGMSTKPAETAKEFTANNVKRLRVLFLPTTNQTSEGKRNIAILEGCRVEEMASYQSPSGDGGDDEDDEGGSTGGSQTPGQGGQGGQGGSGESGEE
ncbi:MAG TPA: HU family DNA-binding protein [Candidatus Prevotella avicola]|uniref:HU family DNA-binding protein n=1 Tax=Candidatus Prevotella avicola TaxID=2838738 RepID=A0A9D2FYC0_9BACT|nr:HU family DNA-binding protein [Candidatus Prevotella avicola]